MLLGYNTAWLPPLPLAGRSRLADLYGRDLITREGRVERALFAARLTKAAGGDLMRVWLCEGRELEGLDWDANGRVKSELLDGLADVMRAAQTVGVSVYWTVFSANVDKSWFSPAPLSSDNPSGDLANRLRSGSIPDWYKRRGDLFRDGARTVDLVLSPLLQAMAPWSDRVFAIDLINEVQALADDAKANRINRVYGSLDESDNSEVRWSDLGDWLTPCFQRIREAGYDVTASVAFHDDTGPKAIETVVLAQDRAGARRLVDVHVYDNGGRFPDLLRASLRQHNISGPSLILGECGTRWDPTSKKYESDADGGYMTDFENFRDAVGWRSSANIDAFYPMFQKLVLHEFVRTARNFDGGAGVRALFPWRLLDWPKEAGARARGWRNWSGPKSLVGVSPHDLDPARWTASTQVRLVGRTALHRLVHLKSAGFVSTDWGDVTTVRDLFSNLADPTRAGADAASIWPVRVNAASSWQRLVVADHDTPQERATLDEALNEAVRWARDQAAANTD